MSIDNKCFKKHLSHNSEKEQAMFRKSTGVTVKTIEKCKNNKERGKLQKYAPKANMKRIEPKEIVSVSL